MQGTVDDVLSGTNKALLGVGAGIGAIALGAVAWLATRHDDDAGAPVHDHDGHDHTHDHVPGSTLPSPSPGPAPQPTGPLVDAPTYDPVNEGGPANLAVAWWPQDISLLQQGDDATLRFQSTIANLGGSDASIRPGDQLRYSISRTDTKGVFGEVVGRGSRPLDRGDLEPFPVSAGHGRGVDLDTLGRDLVTIDTLAPGIAAIVGSGHPVQAISIRDAREGLYVLRQQIVRADGSSDESSFDDVRLTEFFLDGHGGILHTSSRYAGDDQGPTS